VADLAACIARIGGRGRPGTRRVRAVVEARREGATGDSPLEARWLRAFEELGLPRPVTGHQVVLAGRVFVLDLAWPDARVAVEVDGFAAHAGREAFDRDRARANALVNAGWRVFRATSRLEPATVAAQVRAALQGVAA
jgi:hypothetical protein